MDKGFQDIHIDTNRFAPEQYHHCIRQVTFQSVLKRDDCIEIRYMDYNPKSNLWDTEIIFVIPIMRGLSITID